MASGPQTWPLPLRLPSSMGRASLIDSVVAVAATSLTAALAQRPSTKMELLRGWDPGACLASLYILIMYCVQSAFLEWPERGLQRPQAFLLASMGNLLLPSLCPRWVGSWRLASGCLSAALAASAYVALVRGPRYVPPSGSLRDRVFLVTGANSGLGYETSVAVLRAGASVIFACRNEKKATAAMRAAAAAAGFAAGQRYFLPLDLASLKSVRRAVELLRDMKIQVDTLVLNAGVMRRSRLLTEDGLEETMAANHLGHFLLVNLLLPDLLQLEAVGKQPKVVVLGSNICYAHDVFDFSELVCAADPSMRDVFLAKPYSLFRAYGQSKLANLMMCRQLAWRLRQRGSRILVNCVHPGEVLTQVFNDFHPVVLTLYAALRPLAQLFFKTPAMGAVCTTFVAASPSVQVSGEYFMRCRIAKAPEVARDRSNLDRLWALSEELTGIQSSI